MATHLDLEEQEQIDQLKQFWKEYGNLITWVLLIVLLAFAGWNGWHLWQRDQSSKAGALYDEINKATQSGDVNHATALFANLKERYARTAFTEQAGMLLAKLQYDKGQADNARATLSWVSEHATESEYQALARLRLAGVLLDQKKYDEALQQLDGIKGKDFEPLAADRRGDILAAQGKRDAARAAYQQAWSSMDSQTAYRRLIDAKLTAMGAAPDTGKVTNAEAAK